MKNKIILAIETSCDDTSLAIIKDGKILSEYSSSSTKKHKQYGGIIPELAAREHTKAIDNVFRKAIASSKIKKNQLTHIAYTATPGLPGSLHIGKIYAKTLSFLLDIPLIPINHMMGHAFSFAIENKKIIKFPLLSLVISGGNTILYLFKSYDKYEILNQTNDDAIGEALDKIGRVIGFSYPGGISLDNNYNKLKSNLKIINHQKPSCDFTFSGIKTFATNYVNEHKMKNQKYDKIALGSSCLKWCIEEVINKLNYYMEKHNVKCVGIGGGVGANNLLKNELAKLKTKKIFLTSKKWCGDNGSMIAFYTYLTL